MKVEINEIVRYKEREFPKLMKSNDFGFIIIATKGNNKNISGTVVSNNECWYCGRFSEKWSTDRFSDFEGSITLSND